jgi:type I restriction enzyme S subunit
VRNGTTSSQNTDGIGLPVTRIETIRDGVIDPQRVRYVQLPEQEIERWRLREGDILFSHINSVDHIGKTAIYRGSPEILIHGMNLLLLRPDGNRVDPEYLLSVLRAAPTRAYFKSICKKAVNQASVNQKDLASLSICVPPISEQRRIVDLLNHANSIRRLRREAQEKARQVIPALFVEMFGPQALENGLPVRPLSDVADIVSGVTKGRRFNGEQPIEVPYLRVANVQADHLDLSEIKTISALRSDVQRLRLLKGDVLLTEGGDYDKLGRGALLEVDLPDCIHQNHVFRVRVHRNHLHERFFAAYLQTAEAKSYFLRCAKRTTNLASINMSQLRQLPVPVPHISTQDAFAERAADIQSIITQQDRMAAASDQMVDALMAKVFNGAAQQCTEPKQVRGAHAC